MNPEKGNVESFQTLIGVIMGIGMANLLQSFVIDFKINQGMLIWEIDIGAIFSLVGGLVLIVRFFHGNSRMLQELLGISHSGDRSIRASQFMDMSVILSQGMLFCILGLFQTQPANYRWIVIAIYAADTLWLFISKVRSGDKMPESIRKIKGIAENMSAINSLSIVALLFLQIFYLMEMINPTLSAVLFSCVLIAGSLLDYVLNKELFFPSKQEVSISANATP